MKKIVKKTRKRKSKVEQSVDNIINLCSSELLARADAEALTAKELLSLLIASYKFKNLLSTSVNVQKDDEEAEPSEDEVEFVSPLLEQLNKIRTLS